jgi:hypothetical protein
MTSRSPSCTALFEENNEDRIYRKDRRAESGSSRVEISS